MSLKEGLTVFRDQEFSADQRSRPVQRIKDVAQLRARQFPEDGGPLAHPVRPDSYMEINNFYTATVYEKGAELIRMMHTLLGPDGYRKGIDLYFDRHDGQAVTCDDFAKAMEDANDIDFTQLKLWYSQAGTPKLWWEGDYDADAKQYRITLTQKTDPTPGQSDKKPLHMPVSIGLLGADGNDIAAKTVELTQATQEFVFDGVTEKPVVSFNRGFSAPVNVVTDQPDAELAFLMGNDSDAFNRWEAGQTLARKLIGTIALALESGIIPETDNALRKYCEALRNTLHDQNFDNSFKALALTPPSTAEILQSLEKSDPVAVYLAGDWLSRAVGNRLRDDLLMRYHALSDEGTFSPDAESAGRRALRNRCLSLLASGRDAVTAGLATEQLGTATNMTDELAALMTLTKLGGKRVNTSMEKFYEKWKSNPLVMDKWFSVQGMRHHVEGISALEALIEHDAYDRRNPNRVRALIGSFAMANPNLFHAPDGSGYCLLYTSDAADE